jgi:hypothetical protein
MAGQKASAVERTAFPIRLQDGRPLDRVVGEELAGQIQAAAATAAAEVAAVERRRVGLALETAEIELPAGRRSGSLMVEGTFTAEEVGAPVLVTQAPPDRFDEAEFGLVLFVAQVVTTKAMRIAWSASSSVPRRVKLLYIIGRSFAATL